MKIKIDSLMFCKLPKSHVVVLHKITAQDIPKLRQHTRICVSIHCELCPSQAGHKSESRMHKTKKLKRGKKSCAILPQDSGSTAIDFGHLIGIANT